MTNQECPYCRSFYSNLTEHIKLEHAEKFDQWVKQRQERFSKLRNETSNPGRKEKFDDSNTGIWIFTGQMGSSKTTTATFMIVQMLDAGEFDFVITNIPIRTELLRNREGHFSSSRQLLPVKYEALSPTDRETFDKLIRICERVDPEKIIYVPHAELETPDRIEEIISEKQKQNLNYRFLIVIDEFNTIVTARAGYANWESGWLDEIKMLRKNLARLVVIYQLGNEPDTNLSRLAERMMDFGYKSTERRIGNFPIYKEKRFLVRRAIRDLQGKVVQYKAWQPNFGFNETNLAPIFSLFDSRKKYFSPELEGEDSMDDSHSGEDSSGQARNKAVLDLLHSHPEGITFTELCEATGWANSSLVAVLHRLEEARKIEHRKKLYFLAQELTLEVKTKKND